MKVLLHTDQNHGQWQEIVTNERLGLFKLFNTYDYIDFRVELKNESMRYI